MVLPNVAQGDPHVQAHNDERSKINEIDLRTSDEQLSVDIETALTDPGAPRDAADARVAAGTTGKADKTTLKVKTRRATMASGGAGTTSAMTMLAAGGTIRKPFRLPLPPSRFRIRMRNYDTISQTPGSALTCKGVAFGLSNTSAGDYETGLFSGSASVLVQAGDFSIPTDGTFWTSGWIDPATIEAGVPGGREYMVAVAAVPTAGADVSVPRGTGRCFYFAGDVTTGLNSNNSPTALGSTPLDIQIQYEFEGDNRIGLFVGDSITEGVGGRQNDTNMNDPQPTYKAWPHMWAERSHCVANIIALAGTTAAQWSTPTQDRWTRVDLTTTVPDFAVIAFGSNDANASATLATFQASLRTVVANVRAKIGSEKPIYLATITPRNFDAPRETLRLAYNAWLRTGPLRAAGIIDFARTMEDPAAPGAVIVEYFNGDVTHPSRAGYNRMQLSVPYLAGP